MEEQEATQSNKLRLLFVALQESETRYRRLFEAAHDGILILDSDSGEITDVNPFLANLLGYSHAELLGRKIWEIGLFRDVLSSKEDFKELQTKGFIRYENLPLQSRNGKRIDVEVVILDRFQDETNNDTIAACQDHDASIGNSSRKRKPSLPKPPISES